MVVGVQRHACQLAVANGSLLILSTRDVPLAPNGIAIDVAPFLTPRDARLHVGQVVALGASVPPERDADWCLELGEASTWEPRPRIHRIDRFDLVDRLRATRATVIAEGAGESLLSLLWASGPDASGLGPRFGRAAGAPAQLLCAAAIRGDAASVTGAARGLAGLGPGLTPSGDDVLAGFAAAWILVGESLGVDASTRHRVAEALLAGAEHGASPLGRAWLRHACRGELLEPMTRFAAALLAVESHDLHAAVRPALAVGSSSGTDWMVGFLLGASAILDPTMRGRRW